MKTFFFLGDHPKKSHITYMKIFFFSLPKKFCEYYTKSFFDCFSVQSFGFILENCHYFMFSSHFLFQFNDMTACLISNAYQ